MQIEKREAPTLAAEAHRYLRGGQETYSRIARPRDQRAPEGIAPDSTSSPWLSTAFSSAAPARCRRDILYLADQQPLRAWLGLAVRSRFICCCSDLITGRKAPGSSRSL
eukprot:642267-Hanusia_phi.AAC.2